MGVVQNASVSFVPSLYETGLRLDNYFVSQFVFSKEYSYVADTPTVRYLYLEFELKLINIKFKDIHTS